MNSAKGAILFAIDAAKTPGRGGAAALLAPLLGKSLLQRAVEQLARLGVERIVVVTEEIIAADIAAFLGDGERWGCAIKYTMPAQAAYAAGGFASMMKCLGVAADGEYWLADAAAALADDLSQGTPQSGEYACMCEDDPALWTGWGRFSGARLLSFGGAVGMRSAMQALVRDLPPQLLRRLSSPLLEASTPAALLASCQLLLAQMPAWSAPARRGRRFHANAQIISPVWIGDDVRIDGGAVVGPFAVVESGAVVGRGSHVSNSVIMPDTWLGDGLVLSDSVAYKKVLANVRLDALIAVSDAQLLDSVVAADKRSQQSRPSGKYTSSLRALFAPFAALVSSGGGHK